MTPNYLRPLNCMLKNGEETIFYVNFMLCTFYHSKTQIVL